jgi:mannose-1-phosphate guanylyltransferase
MNTTSTHQYIIIMAGGAGTRFWPASTEDHPKQFLDILGMGKSLLRLTYERFLPLVPKERIYIVTNKKYLGLVQHQLPELPAANILGEPSRNNTAPCIAYAAYKIAALDPKAVFVVAPSDHLILKENYFLNKIETALEFTAQEDAICTLGIQPTRPDTGYGYIHYADEQQGGIHDVLAFREKPDAETAAAYLADGHYLWNAGIFIFSARSIITALEKFAPAICERLASLPYNTPQEQAFLDQYYPHTPDISIDYAVMEPADNVYTIPVDIGWSDLGTWASLHSELPKDEQGNAVQAGRALVADASGNLIRVQHGKTVVVRGINDMIVVDEPEALLIYPIAFEQEIKGVTKKLKE